MASAFMTSISTFLLPTTDVFSTLEVTRGLHRGVAIPVEQPVCRIGSSRHADVMLSDDAVVAEHATLRFHARMVAIEAVGGDIEVNGKRLPHGTGWRTALPVTLDIGEVRLQLSRPELSLPPAVQAIQEIAKGVYRATGESITGVLQAARQRVPPALHAIGGFAAPGLNAIHRALSPLFLGVRRFVSPGARWLGRCLAPASRWIREQGSKIAVPKRWRERLMPRRRAVPGTFVKRSAAVTALCMAVALIGIYQFVGVGKADASISPHALHSAAFLHPQAAEAARLLMTPSLSPSEALAQQLEEAGLDSLQVRDAGNHLVVSGEFAPERYDAWRDVQRWFDQHHGSSQVLISDARPGLALDAPAFQFQAVWFGDNPYVIDARGERLYPGAALREGWVLAEIGDSRVTVRRGDDEFSLTL
ncbi:SctD/MshK family protein [Halomonas maura]|uniref:SctD/MshK family protein n=1 Tax=Halomonas maura TaxID=117606 RepID=UPI0025B3CF33|nr:FHA domain-containing protein [Halomonas maura]MDN3556892.1 FHA domain-containing protein [Halomonas maura]